MREARTRLETHLWRTEVRVILLRCSFLFLRVERGLAFDQNFLDIRECAADLVCEVRWQKLSSRGPRRDDGCCEQQQRSQQRQRHHESGHRFDGNGDELKHRLAGGLTPGPLRPTRAASATFVDRRGATEPPARLAMRARHRCGPSTSAEMLEAPFALETFQSSCMTPNSKERLKQGRASCDILSGLVNQTKGQIL